ncbi:MAG: hypothetical protein NC926_06110 [Candidatus Omnitrophica bacterium]|nr:hypothetical protein [Candidatus Omnitrophota bacterium]MCM8807502.1 hypothetical protein [Candidatus Omnitrophota bacterium]
MIKEIPLLLYLNSLTFIIWIITTILFRIKKVKGFVALILSLIFTFFVFYYNYLILFEKPTLQSFEKYENMGKIILKPRVEEHKESPEIFLFVKINDSVIKIGLGDEIEIKKNTTFTIEDVEGIDKENLKVNFVGFVGNQKYNDGQDIGYKINYKDLRKNKAIEKDKYEIEIKKKDKKIGSVFVKFVD